jgi:hypothetical protein
MSKFLQLQIPKPCHEDWNSMNPEAQGRFCNSCQKTVTDFTQMSDAQLIAFFKKPKQSTCGRFTQEQLENDIPIPRKRIPWVKYFFQIAIPAFLLSVKAVAQTGRTQLPIEKITAGRNTQLKGSVFQDTLIQPANDITITRSLTGTLGGYISSEVKKHSSNITGTIKDTEGRAISFASVNIKGARKGVVADSLGNFSIKEVSLPCTLITSSVGFIINEFYLSSDQKSANIQLSMAPALAGEVVIVGGYRSSKWVNKKRNKKYLKEEICLKPIPSAPTLSVYPNPIASSTPLHLKWQNLEAGNYVIEVYSISGTLMQSQKLILEKDLKATALSIDQLTGGNYFVRLINDKTGKQLSQLFIVQE